MEARIRDPTSRAAMPTRRRPAGSRSRHGRPRRPLCRTVGDTHLRVFTEADPGESRLALLVQRRFVEHRRPRRVAREAARCRARGRRPASVFTPPKHRALATRRPREHTSGGGSISKLLATLAAAVVAATLSAPAKAANAFRFADPSGDGRSALDVTAVDVANDDAGLLTFAITTAGAPSPAAGTVFRVLVDVDGNPDTGPWGADFELVADGGSLAIRAWNGTAWEKHVPRTTPTVTWSNGPVITVDRAELGAPDAFGFWVEAARTTRGETPSDRAPDTATWSYDIVAPDADGDRVPDAGDNCPYISNRQFDTDGDGLGNECDGAPFPLDERSPVVEALPSGVTPAGVAYLRYRLWEDSRATSERVRIVIAGRTRAVLNVPLAQLDDGATYETLWRVPRDTTGTASFCVRASDTAGNVSQLRCAPLSLMAVPASAAAAVASSAVPDGTLSIGGRRKFVLGLSNGPALGAKTPSGEDALAEVIEGGINLFRIGPSTRGWSDADIAEIQRWSAAVARLGAHLWVSLRDLGLATPGSPEAADLRRVVEALRHSPGLGLWRGMDEPWWIRWPASALTYAYETVRSLDPAHPMLTVQAPRGTRWDLEAYSAATDAHGINAYPVTFRTRDPQLHIVGQWTAMVRSVTPSNAVVTTLQICSSGSVDPIGSGAYVLPTLRQERYMAYDAIVNGARGLVFFGGGNSRCMVPADVPYAWNWTFWRTVLRPLLAEIGPAAPLQRALLGRRLPLRLRVNDPGTQVDVRAGGPGELWVIAARHGAGKKQVRIAGLPGWAQKASVYREPRTLRTRNGVIVDRFAQWDVHVYRFTR